MGCKIEDGFTDIFKVLGCYLGWVEGAFCLAIVIGLFISYAAKRKNSWNHLAMAQPSLFFPHFDFTLMNVYMNTGIK